MSECLGHMLRKCSCSCLGLVFLYVLYFNEHYLDALQFFYYSRFGDHSERHNLQVSVKPNFIIGSKQSVAQSPDGKIPKIIHQTSWNETLPNIVKPWVKSWMKYNPDYEYWFWTDTDIRNLIALRYPDFLFFFDRYSKGVHRADVFRYFALYEFGGVYADVDVECLKPLQVKMDEYGCILSQEPNEQAFFVYLIPQLVSNAFLACRSRHPFYKYVIEHLIQYLDKPDVVEQTGPVMLHAAYVAFSNISYPTEVPYIAPAETYQPKIDPRRIAEFQQSCEAQIARRSWLPPTRKKFCQNILAPSFTNKPTKNSYTVHHWTHTWLHTPHDEFGAQPEQGTFLITDLL